MCQNIGCDFFSFTGFRGEDALVANCGGSLARFEPDRALQTFLGRGGSVRMGGGAATARTRGQLSRWCQWPRCPRTVPGPDAQHHSGRAYPEALRRSIG